MLKLGHFQLVARPILALLGGVILSLALNTWLSKTDGLVLMGQQSSSLITYNRIGFWGGLIAGLIACGVIVAKTITGGIRRR